MPGADDHDGLPNTSAEITDLTDEQLLIAIQRSEEIRRRGRERSGRLLAELHRRGHLSWPAIARRTGIRQTTAYEMAQPYIVVDDGPEQPPA